MDSSYQILGHELRSDFFFFSDSDWAGDKETMKSSSARVALVGRHFFESVHEKTEDHRQKQ